MIAFGIIAIVLFAIGWFVFGWLNYIGIVLGTLGIIFGGVKKKKATLILGIIGTSLCTVGGVIMLIWYATM